MKLATVVLAAALALGASAGAARAEGPRGPRPLHDALIQRFDRNHDGRLEPPERRRAIRALRKMERRLARAERRAERADRGERGRGNRVDRMVRRYDLNGDGVVGPGEMPPAQAERLRRFDRNGDGWVDGGELR